MSQITIIGTGLIGTSIGLALKNVKNRTVQIVGHDREPTASRRAQKMGAVDKLEWNLLRAVRDADMVIMATPVVTMRTIMQEIAEVLPEDCIVTDTGSTKQQVLQWADEILPPHVDFVGGHPMAGKESSGPDEAEASLFKDAAYCVLPSPKASKFSAEAVVSLAETLGAKPFFIDAQEHDSLIAAVSHLPIALSAALVRCTTKSPSWGEMARLTAGGYRDITRLASGDPEMNRDIYLTNSKEIGVWLDRVIGELLEIRRHLEEGDEAGVARLFATAYEEREKWVAGVIDRPGGVEVELPTVGEQMSNLLVGELLAKRGRDLMKQYGDEGQSPRRKP